MMIIVSWRVATKGEGWFPAAKSGNILTELNWHIIQFGAPRTANHLFPSIFEFFILICQGKKFDPTPTLFARPTPADGSTFILF
jgi:hypothetical protein